MPSSNYVWPIGFTPDSANIPGFSTDSNASESINIAQLIGNHSPATDMRLINALENQAAYIQGNPGQDDDIELFYYRFVSTAGVRFRFSFCKRTQG